MLETALTASPIDHKVTALKPTHNPLKVMRKPSREVWYRQHYLQLRRDRKVP